MSSEENDSSSEQRDEERELHERTTLPLVIPVIVFLFTLLVIYGLSRIFLELSAVSIGDTTLATPLAIGVALAILAAAAYMASTPRLQQWQIASFGLVAVGLLTGGAIIAAVNDEGESEVSNGHDGEPTAVATVAPGSVAISLTDDFTVIPSPATISAGSVTFVVSNDGAIFHNLRIIRTDDAPDALPTADGLADESQLTVVASSVELAGGEMDEIPVDLEPGNYVLICNEPGHYLSGMRAAITVE